MRWELEPFRVAYLSSVSELDVTFDRKFERGNFLTLIRQVELFFVHAVTVLLQSCRRIHEFLIRRT